MMEKLCVTVKVVSPLFMYGANKTDRRFEAAS
ncbi:Hypothetical protein DEACI_3645 [Acididesulfobacillus acetoxydans]|uniref:Uncharacterized protein n=1 Tax=Acididesulfobacillus acetoxydans TaxID=1561005 RepID=A0A8S0WHN7_9FIRM|nr:Hypothetical protein DEACI_3645 [Acididesulfobacillus acetoxydans]CEJ05703.1 Hypothetical protein DEACI_0122 [Acididesulfobacillus acetoxydans]